MTTTTTTRRDIKRYKIKRTVTILARSSSKYSSTAKTRHVRYVNDTFVKYAREFAREATLGGAVRVDDVIAAVELELGDVNAVSDGTFIDARWGIDQKTLESAS